MRKGLCRDIWIEQREKKAGVQIGVCRHAKRNQKSVL